VRLNNVQGSPSELLVGPVQYGLVFTVASALFFRRLEGTLPLNLLCVGDGFAGLIGSWYRSSSSSRGAPGWLATLPWNRNKSLVGLLSFIVTSLVSQFFMAWLFADRPGWWTSDAAAQLALPTLYAVLVGALVESHPLVGANDNLFVFLAGLATLWLVR
jgi:dolichol kinase